MISKIKINNNRKELSINLFLISIFVCSVVIRSLLAIKLSDFSITPDEVLHWSISKSIAGNGQVAFRNINIGYSEVLYSALISITHIVGDVEKAYIITKIINCILMSSAVFPIYFMSIKVLKKIDISLLISIIGIIIPELCYAGKILQENLFYPMFMWFWYFVIIMMYEQKFNRKNIMLMSIYVFLMGLCKQMGLTVFAGLMLFFIIDIIFYKGDRGEKDIELLLFLLTFATVKGIHMILFKYLNNPTDIIAGGTISTIISSLIDMDTMMKMIYPFFIYILMSIIGFGIFTILIPISCFKKMEENEQKLLILIICIMLSTICVICLAIISKENFEHVSIRVHLRYYYYMFIPSLILFFKCEKSLEKKSINDILVFMIIVILSMIFILDIIPEKHFFDAPSLGIVMSFAETDVQNIALKFTNKNDILSLTIKSVIVIIILSLTYMLYKKKNKMFYNSIVILIIINSVINNMIVYKNEGNFKNSKYKIKDEAKIIDSYLNENLDEQDDIIILAERAYSEAHLENYLTRPYFLILSENFNKAIKDENNNIFKNMKLNSFNESYDNNKFDEPEYIITNRSLNINGYELINLEVKNYKIYKRNNDDICVKYYVDGLYNDNWMGKECEIDIYDKSSSKEIQIEVDINPIFSNENSIEYTDGCGNSNRFDVKEGLNVYTLKSTRSSEDDNFKIKLKAQNTVNLKKYSDRNLSVKIIDVKIKNN